MTFRVFGLTDPRGSGHLARSQAWSTMNPQTGLNW
jgi:hypothetical protein